jgi:hypothetical protein
VARREGLERKLAHLPEPWSRSRRIEPADLHAGLAGVRRRVRDPRTLALLAKRML